MVLGARCKRRSRVVGLPVRRRWRVDRNNPASVIPRKGKTEMKKNVVIAFLALLFAPLFAHAQGLGSIVGRVTDPAGSAVAGAQVTATQEGTGFSRSAVTDADGLYVIPSLQPATYNVSVEAKGFST